MATCEVCQQEMKDANTTSCTNQFIKIGGKWYRRNNTYYDDNERCHDCNIINGSHHYHHPGCDMERCPVCGMQAIGCDCPYDNVMVHVGPCPECEGTEHLPDMERKHFVCQTKDCGEVVEVVEEVNQDSVASTTA